MVQMSEGVGAGKPAARPRRRFRQIVFRIHTWLGLHICIVLGAVFLSGTLIMLSPELTVLGRGHLYIKPPAADAPRASLGTVYDNAVAAFPGGVVGLIEPAPRPWIGIPVYASDADNRRMAAWMHPVDGSLVGMKPVNRLDIRNIVRTMHDSLLVSVRPAEIAVNSLSLVLLTMVVTGLITYRRFWKGLFRRPAPGTDARTWNGVWHRTVAVWLVPFLLIMVVTSLVFLAEGLGVKPRNPEPAPMAERDWRLPEGFDGAALDEIVAIARDAVPGLEPEAAGLPFTRRNPFSVRGYVDGSPKLLGPVNVIIDPATKEVLGINGQTDGNTMSILMILASALHFGKFGGLWTVALWFVFGLASTFLLFTGARIYALRTIRERGADTVPRGTFRILWQGLGIFRWAYLLTVLVMIASVTYRAF